MPYEGLDDRMDRLETVLTDFIRHTDEGMKALREDMATFRDDMSAFREGMTGFREDMGTFRNGMAAFREDMGTFREGMTTFRDGMTASREDMGAFRESLTALSDGLASLRREVDRDIIEMRQWRIQSQKRWGEIAEKMGKFVEDIAAPNIPRLAQEVLQLGTEEIFSAPRVRLRHPQDSSKMREFDYVYATPKGWILVESKSDPKLKDVDAFREILADAREYFPQYASTPLYPIFTSLYLPDHVVSYCTRHGIYALGMGPETMQLLNLADLRG
jgi:hypothetical protein